MQNSSCVLMFSFLQKRCRQMPTKTPSVSPRALRRFQSTFLTQFPFTSGFCHTGKGVKRPFCNLRPKAAELKKKNKIIRGTSPNPSEAPHCDTSFPKATFPSSCFRAAAQGEPTRPAAARAHAAPHQPRHGANSPQLIFNYQCFSLLECKPLSWWELPF